MDYLDNIGVIYCGKVGLVNKDNLEFKGTVGRDGIFNHIIVTKIYGTLEYGIQMSNVLILVEL